MPFSKFLLIAMQSEKRIYGQCIKGQKHWIEMSEVQKHELPLFFQFDTNDKTKDADLLKSLDWDGEGIKCCDGLIFYHDDNKSEKVICLVEMKSRDPQKPYEQIGQTYKCLKALLGKECLNCNKYFSHIVWKACIYRHTSAPDEQKKAYKRKLAEFGFVGNNIIKFTDPQNKDIGPFLRGQEEAFSKDKKARK